MGIIVILFLATCFLAYSNGANDNFKGVATLFGSKTTNYKSAILWATITTFSGSIFSIFLAASLVKSFSGKGLVPDATAVSSNFLIAVVIATGITIILATLLGFPVSTTHGLTGALVGSGFMAVDNQVNLSVLGKSFFLPLILSPVVAILLSLIFYSIFRFFRIKSGLGKEVCICIDGLKQVIPLPSPSASLSFSQVLLPQLVIDNKENCVEKYSGQILGVETQKILDTAHFLSAGVVSFARGLNDTPKIVALLLASQAIKMETGMLVVAVGMAIGGLLNAKKVGETMSNKITKLNHGQGFTANLVTGILVILASKFGLPVSTTHVSVGSIFGIGLITQEANTKTIASILLSWILTLPTAAIISGLLFLLFKNLV